MSPDGGRVFVLAQSQRPEAMAYDAATGATLWHVGITDVFGIGTDLEVSPDGATVFATGMSYPWAMTAAIDAATGAKRWLALDEESSFGFAVAVDPSGQRVYTAGLLGPSGNPSFGDMLVVGHDVASGGQVWRQTYDGPQGDGDQAMDAGVSPDGSKVFLTGWGDWSSFRDDSDYTTIAFDASTGAQQWVSVYDPTPAHDFATALGVSPSGTSVYVTGASTGADGSLDYATLGYDASSGSQVWASAYAGPGHGTDWPVGLTVTPDGLAVEVTGYSRTGPGAGIDFVTISYRA